MDMEPPTGECGYINCSMEGRKGYESILDDDSVALVDIEDECAALREAVTKQQQAIRDLIAELEEERNAASSAANEAMSMILRLQREKAEAQMEARQFIRFAEERSSQDQKELLELEDLLYKREQAIHSLTCEVQAYKYRLMSFGLSESEADIGEGFGFGYGDGGEYELLPPYEYPPLRCNVINSGRDNNNNNNADSNADVEKYVFAETPKERYWNLENRISHMEKTTPTYSQMDGDFNAKNYFLEKMVVGHSPRRAKHSRRYSSLDSPASLGHDQPVMDSPKLNGTNIEKIDKENNNNNNNNHNSNDDNNKNNDSSLKKVENNINATSDEEGGDDMCDRVCTVDSVHNGVTEFIKTDCYGTNNNRKMEHGNHHDEEFEDPYVKKLYMRLQALEADRESMRQAIISMRTDKAQVVLLKEIALQLCKDISPQRKKTTNKPLNTIFKWVKSILFWRKNAHEIKYMFGLPNDSVGLLMLLDKEPHVKSWRYVSNTQLLGD